MKRLRNKLLRRFVISVGMVPNDPKLSHSHRRLTLDCNLDSQSSYLNRNLKRLWLLAPVWC